MFLQLSAVSFNLAVSTAMSFINKWALIIYPLPSLLLVLQMLAAVLIIMPMPSAGLSNFDLWSWPRCRQLLSISFFYVLNTGFSLGGLAKINIPIYTTLKRLTPVCILLIKVAMTRQLPPWRVSMAVLMVVLGCVLAGAGDLEFDLMGYLYSLTSCVTQAAYFVLVEIQGAKGISATEMLWYNSISCLPMLMVSTWYSGEWILMESTFYRALTKHGLTDTLLAIALCSTGGIILNFSQFLATVVGSALFVTILNNVKTVVVIVLGFFLLGGAQLTPLMALGIVINLSGGVWYGQQKFKAPSLAASSEAAGLKSSSPSSLSTIDSEVGRELNAIKTIESDSSIQSPSLGSGAQVHFNQGHHRHPVTQPMN
ncbi:hypothetical protein CEUSTIGMA_g4434.t1 [Chlamydomonas eustigma]|uniref:Sugar phosphate transporter domain-containing protein n=1 Tax=Chlamydomonas eustigma TaxID=1157962 RepID=A0A250X1M8_9CHLO|nr:hypothetical protein CEUSTIGMA_g4434.t1 [Chlamydomonas eustigma]|eukprot:GAX76987.1 hypothetical protein CEUSTIGMA_g4434.t1 [Chlamydomonas eustigma]